MPPSDPKSGAITGHTFGCAMALETLSLEHLPVSHVIRLALFYDVKNVSFLHRQLLEHNAAFEYAFVDASVILSRRQLISAVFKSVLAALNGCLKTANVHSEIVASLSTSNNIADAYRRFGISPQTKDLLVVKVVFPTKSCREPLSDAAIWHHLSTNVEGKAASVTDENINLATNLTKVRKYYKINGLSWLENIKNQHEQRLEMEKIILGSMALRGL